MDGELDIVGGKLCMKNKRSLACTPMLQICCREFHSITLSMSIHLKWGSYMDLPVKIIELTLLIIRIGMQVT